MFTKNNLRSRLSVLIPAAVLLILVIGPLLAIFARAVFQDGRFDLMPALRDIARSENLRTILNSLSLAFAVVLLSTVIALPLAYLFSKTQFARYKAFDIIFMIPFMTPPYIASMGWILFTQKRGLFQQLFPFTGKFSEQFFSFGGLVLVMALHIFPFMLTLLKNAMLNIPDNLDEAGRVFGGRFFYRMRRIFLPLLSTNYVIGALLVFVKTLSEYGTPATLGRRINFEVFTTEIHKYATIAPVQFGSAASLSSVLISICLILWFGQNYLAGKRSYSLVSGRGKWRQLVDLNRLARILAWIFVGLVILLAIVVPYFSVIATSLIKLRGYGLARGNFTFQHYVDLFTLNSKGTSALTTSLGLALVSATLAVILGTFIIVTARRQKRSIARLLESVSLAPSMLPSIVLVLGIMIFWNSIYRYVPLYNTLGIMVVAYVGLFLPYTIQYVNSSFSQIGKSLTEAGRAFGGTPSYVFRRITLPLISKGMISAWMMTFIIAFRELVTASLIAPPNTLVVSTFITREFDQGSVSIGMAMAVICVLLTTGSLLLVNRFIESNRHA